MLGEKVTDREDAGLLVGITGNSGCGQTTAAEFIRDRCRGICSLDGLGHRLLGRRYVAEELALQFSRPDLVGLDQEILRRKLREIILNDSDAFLKLNSILHPRMIRWVKGQARRLGERKGIWVLEGALICEMGLERILDHLVVIVDTEERCIGRAAVRDGIGIEHVSERWQMQMPMEKKSAMADSVLENSGDLRYLRDGIISIFAGIEAKHYDTIRRREYNGS